jgi:membrane-bound lytic murein transglycosylase F
MRFSLYSSVFVLLVFSSCDRHSQPGPTDQELLVLTRMAPTTYYQDQDGNPAGPEYDLVKAFARERNLAVNFEVADTIEEIFQRLKQGEADLAAAGLTLTDTRRARFQAGPAYQEVSEICVCRKGLDPDSPADLVGLRLAIGTESSYEETLKTLKTTIPGLEWSAVDLSTEQLLQQVWEGKIDCTVADSNIVDINQRYFPEIKRAFSLGDKQSLVWYLPEEGSITPPELQQWFGDLRQSGRLDEILNRYYGHIDEFDYYDTRVFLDRMEGRLQKYEPLFREAASEAGFPWPLIAAIAYQESQWNPRATSPTGVRGLFMLTEPTAKSLGVTNRLDPRQSTLGGARYLQKLFERLPPFIQSPDRLWMALAAYNVGYSHLQDARRLAIDLDQDPNRWHSLKEVLPHLTQKKYYRRLRHGYARGHEPVLFVERIRHYQDLLTEKLDRQEDLIALR